MVGYEHAICNPNCIGATHAFKYGNEDERDIENFLDFVGNEFY